MKALKDWFKPVKSDPFGLDSSIAGIRQLRARVESEKSNLATLQEQIRDKMLDDPSAELDELPVIRQQARIKIVEASLEKALSEAASHLDSRMPELKEKIDELQVKETALRRRRDEERLRAVADFCKATGARVAQMPKRGQGGAISVEGLQAMENHEAVEFFSNLDTEKSESTPTAKKLNDIVQEQHRLEMIKHLGAKAGLQTLAGTT